MMQSSGRAGFIGGLGAQIALAVLASACGERPLEPRDPTPGVAYFKIASFNIEVGDERDPETVGAIGATAADIICLQEVSAEWEPVIRARYSADYPHMLFHPGGAGGLGVLSKWELAEGEFIDASEEAHPAWSLFASTPAGTMNILNVHLRSLYSGSGGVVNDYLTWGSDHVVELRSVVASEPTRVVESLPRIVVGDFNEGTNGDAVAYLERLGFSDALPLYHPGQFTWRHASLGNQFTESLDHVLFDEWFAPLNAFVLVKGNSDHIPVVAHLEAARAWPSVTLSQLSTASE
ncbi:MAG TPA: endonuclease/exonuclease/phosphatase family protein [Polyangiaceae bacterium]|nr:endonuclease/exonuclease/phosphatase family protein [Polyangiaceae bacterium]